MDYFNDIYKKRINRYGTNWQERMQGKREANFENYLLKTTTKVTFLYDFKDIEGSLERYKQDKSQTLMYLLLRIEDKLQIGDIIFIENIYGKNYHFLVYYEEDTASSGYNRYILIKLNKYIEVQNIDKDNQYFMGYFYRSGNSIFDLMDATSIPLFQENNRKYYIITSFDKTITPNTYITINTNDKIQYFKIETIDYFSIKNIMQLELVIHSDIDLSPNPNYEKDKKEEFFWLGVDENE